MGVTTEPEGRVRSRDLGQLMKRKFTSVHELRDEGRAGGSGVTESIASRKARETDGSYECEMEMPWKMPVIGSVMAP